jgi:eukaryotic-like serine/threonine-protein kinase
VNEPAALPRPAASPARLGRSLDESAVGLRFVQDRLALFGKTLFCFAGVYLALAVVLSLRGVMPFFAPGRESHLAATLISLLLWRIAKNDRTLGASSLKALDALGTIGLSVCLVVMGHRFAQLFGAPSPSGNFAGILSVFHVVLTRAVLVPSTPRRTLSVTAACFLGLVVSQQLLFFQFAPASPFLRSPWLVLVSSMTWSATGTARATVASRVIFGLHTEVRKARQLGQYTLEDQIGRGGMGEVYRARHAMLRRPTAIKLMAKDVSERELTRFEREVQLTAQLTHPNTISIYDYGRTPEGTFYYVMELLDGVTLQQLVERDGAQPAGRVIHILLQVCAALREAHLAGLIHRDIKPDNVFLCRRGALHDVVKVLDFGLVKQVATNPSASETNVDTIVGTPLYLSPEAILARDEVDGRSDLYALGAVGYFLLSGAPVFTGNTAVEVCGHHLHTLPEPPSARAAGPIPRDLEGVILDCLAKDPAGRPESAEALSRRLSACTEAGNWSEADAKKWWRRHEAPAESSVNQPASRTLEIALEGRGLGVAADQDRR